MRFPDCPRYDPLFMRDITWNNGPKLFGADPSTCKHYHALRAYECASHETACRLASLDPRRFVPKRDQLVWFLYKHVELTYEDVSS